MASLIPVPTLRSSDVLVQQRLLSQIRNDQLDLLGLQNQMSTGRRIITPSDDAPSAVRAMTLQRLLEQKSQSLRNIDSSQSYLTATDSAINGASDLMTEMRSLALAMVDNTRSETEREAASFEVSRAIDSLLASANRVFRERSLFAGAKAGITPFTTENGFIAFHGDDGQLGSFGDLNALFQSNATAEETFGAFSPGVQSTVDLNPVLTENTRLSEIRGGEGVTLTSIIVSDDSNQETIDVSGAETVGDIIDLLEANPPEGRRIRARVVGSSIQVEIDPGGGGNLNIREVGGGTTAAELGIYAPNGVGLGPLVGEDIDPVLTPTTRLENILGSRATAVLRSIETGPGTQDLDNDLLFTAKLRGAEFNNYSIQYVDDAALQAAPGLVAGSEVARLETSATPARAAVTLSGNNNNLILTADTPGDDFNNVEIRVVSGGLLDSGANATFNAADRVLEIEVDAAGNSQIQNVIAAIDGSTPFTATYDASDASDGGYVPTALVNATDINSITNNTGNSGGDANTIFIHVEDGQSTAADVLDALNEPSAGIADLFDIELDEKDANEDLSSPPGSGLITVSATAVTAYGSGIEFDKSSGLLVTNGQQTHTIDLLEVETVEQLLDKLNASKAFVSAQINAAGDSIQIRSRLSGTELTIGENGGQTATQLGVRSFAADTPLSELNFGAGVHTDDGDDFTIRRSDGTEIGIDVSSAATVQDVIDIINATVGETVARLAETGNGIQIFEANPTGGVALAIIRNTSSNAAWDLGLTPRGADIAYSSDADPPQAATAALSFASPDNKDNAFVVTAKQAGTAYNGVQIVIDGSGATKAATAAFNSGANTLTITIDPSQTTTNDIVSAINSEANLPFTAEVDTDSDPTNTGDGLIPVTGPIGLTGGGTLNSSAQAASVITAFQAPYSNNSHIRITAAAAGTAFNDVVVEFRDTLAGDVATASYDAVAKRLTIDVDEGVTTANTVIAALGSVSEFNAALDTTTDPTNDGSGAVAAGEFTLSGGTPEAIQGDDTNPHEVHGVFNTLIKLKDALAVSDLGEIERLVDSLDVDFNRLNFTRADMGARQRALDSLKIRIEDEDIELKETLSLELDVDLVEAISNLTARQAAFEASLRLIGQTFNLSLLDFI